MKPTPVARSSGRLRLLIVDGHAYAYRAFHAIRELRAGDGSPTNAIFGFIKMLGRMRELLQPEGVAVIWDGGLAAERVEALPEYKSHRPPMPEDLRPQLDAINLWLEAVGLAWFMQEGVEADDWIATMTRQAVTRQWEVVIASSDKDFMQLVSPEVGLLNPNDKSETIWRKEEVQAKTGVDPAQIVDWLSLIGDAVDNIPGVTGVGPKTATDLMTRFGSVETLYGRLGEVGSDRLRAALEAARQAVQRNQRLIRLQDELPVEFPAERLRPGPGDRDQQRTLYQQWGFRTLLAATDPVGAQQGVLSL